MSLCTELSGNKLIIMLSVGQICKSNVNYFNEMSIELLLVGDSHLGSKFREHCIRPWGMAFY